VTRVSVIDKAAQSSSVEGPLVFVVAGEPSADLIGGRFMRALKAQLPVRFVGVGGPLMMAEGLKPLFPMSDLSVMGFIEIVPHIPRLLRRIGQTVKAVRALKPDIVVTIDAPDFNLRVMRRLKDEGIPLVHYVAPTVWAYRPGRAAKIARFLDHVLLLFPFEPPYFDAVGLDSTFVGHPLVEEGIEVADGRAFRAQHDIAPDATLLMVLPGSRSGEIARHLPVYHETLNRLHQRMPEITVVVPAVPAHKDAVFAAARRWPQRVITVESHTEKYAAMAASTAALAASGTVTLELAIAAVPMVVCYKANSITMAIARRVVRVPQIAMANIVAGEAVAPEFVQERCTPTLLSQALEELITDRPARELQTKLFRKAARNVGLGGAPPSERAAKAVIDILNSADGTPL